LVTVAVLERDALTGALRPRSEREPGLETRPYAADISSILRGDYDHSAATLARLAGIAERRAGQLREQAPCSRDGFEALWAYDWDRRAEGLRAELAAALESGTK
jgi:hypothetical protein